MTGAVPTLPLWIMLIASSTSCCVLGGSASLPWIHNPRDKDYIVYVKDNTSISEMVSTHLELRKYIPKVVVCRQPHSPQIGRYMGSLCKPVWGNPEVLPKYKSLWEDRDQNICDILRWVPNYPCDKWWYHVITVIYALDIGSFNFTEQQIENINLCHDRRMTPEIWEIIESKCLAWAGEFGIPWNPTNIPSPLPN